MQTPPLLLTLPDTIPTWIAGKPAKLILEVVTTACQHAGITGPAQFRFLVDPKGLTHRMPPHSLMLRPTAPYNRPDLVAIVACAQSPTQHRVHCTLTLPAMQRDVFARFIQSQDKGTFVLNTLRNPVLPPGLPLPPAVLGAPMSPSAPDSVPPAPAAPEFDDDALALYLSSIRESGGIVTQSTGVALAQRATGDSQILTATRLTGLLHVTDAGLLEISPTGHTLLKRLDAPAVDATKPTPSDFDRLKAALLAARARHQAAKAAHDARAQSLTALTHQLAEAREALRSEELNCTTLQNRLEKLQQDLTSARCKVTGARRHVLDLEEQASALAPDSPDLIQAERTLQEAEAAYQQLIAL